MHFDLDHVFIARGDHAVVEQALAPLGLGFGASRTHPGQGTANRCAYFSNAYLEILFPRADVPLDVDLVRPLGLLARLSSASSASPIGLAYRAPYAHRDPRGWPFETWAYSPPYLPGGMEIAIVTPRERVDEPLVFVLPYEEGRSTRLPVAATALEGARETVPWAGRRLARVRVERPTQLPLSSPAVSWFVRNGAFDLEQSERGHWLTLDFEDSLGRSFEGDERAPISVHW